MQNMIVTPSYTFTRPADTTAYTAADLVANSTTAGSVVPMSFSVARMGSGRGRIKRVRLFKDDETITNANFTLHLFSASPTVTNGDNGAFAVATAATHLGEIEIDMTAGAFPTATDLIEAVAVSPEINFDLGNERVLYGLIEAGAGYTPASGESFTVTLEIEG